MKFTDYTVDIISCDFSSVWFWLSNILCTIGQFQYFQFSASAVLIFQIILFQNGHQQQNDQSPQEETLRSAPLTCCNLHSCLLMDRDGTNACIIYLIHVYNTLSHILSPFTSSTIHPSHTDPLYCANKFLVLPPYLDFIEILNVRKNTMYITILLNVHICWMNEFCGYIPL